MPYDRGQWRYSGTGGYSVANNSGDKFNFKKSDSSSYNLKKCPLCGKKQNGYRDTCISCNYNFDKRDKDLENSISKFRKWKMEIPPVKLQKIVKKNYFSNTNFINDFKLISSEYESIFNLDSNHYKILFVSDDVELLDIVRKDLIKKEDNLIFRFNEDSVNVDALIGLIDEFIMINNYLSKFSVKKFNNINSLQPISDLKYLIEDVHYINEDDAKLLNDFIKIYWKFYERSLRTEFDPKMESYDFKEVLSNQSNELIKLKKYINWFENNINKLTETYDLIGINYGDILNKINLMDCINILEKSPCLIDKKVENSFISDLENYQNENANKENIHDKIIDIMDNQTIDYLVNFDKFSDTKIKYEKINDSISDLKIHLTESGVNCNNLDEYYNLKNKMPYFSSLIYFDDERYKLLNQKLSQYISKYSQSFSFTIENKKNALNSSISKLIDENCILLADIHDLNEKMIEIQNIFDEIGVNLDSISEIDNKDSLNLLYENITFNSSYDSELKHALDEFENNLGSYTINDYFINTLNQLNNSINEIFSKLNINSNEYFEREYIEYNIRIIKEIIEKMGISITSIIELDNFLNLLDLNSLDEVNIRKKLRNLNTDNVSEGNLHYLNNATFEDILYDLNMLCISVKSLIYEFDKNNDYIYLNDLKNELSYPSTQDFKFINDFKFKILSMMESKDFEKFMNNFPDIFKNCYTLIDKFNLTECMNEFENLEKEFDILFKIYSNVGDGDFINIMDGTQKHIIELKNNVLINSKFNELYKKGVFTDKTIILIENNEIKNYLNNLHDLFYSIKDDLIDNSLEYLSCDEIISRNENLLSKYQSKNEHYQEILSEIEKIDTQNFYEIYLKIEKHFTFPSEVKDIKNDFKLIEDILSYNSKLNINDNIIEFNYEMLKEFKGFLDNCSDFSSLVDNGIILDKTLSKFSEEIHNIDANIESIKKELSNLDLDYNYLNNLSKINSENLDEIQFRLDEISKIKSFKSEDIVRLLKNQMTIIDIANSLWVDFPGLLEDKDTNLDADYYKNELLNLRKNLVKYNQLLELENNVLDYSEIINYNLLNVWDGIFTDIEQIKSKFKIDNEFTELYNKGIFTDKTIECLNLLSAEDINFIKDFKEQLSDENLKSEYVLVYNNKEYLLEELDKLEKIDKSDLNEVIIIFKNLNNILKSGKIDDSISILEYHYRKNVDKNSNESYNELNSFSGIYYKYFDDAEFNLSIEEILNKINISVKFTDLIDNEIIKESYLSEIRSEWGNFEKKIIQLEENAVKIQNNFDLVLNEYSKKQFSIELNEETTFNRLKKLLRDMRPNIYLANLEYARNNFKNKHFDYVICDDNELSEEDMIYLFLISRHKLNIFHVGD